MSWMPGPLHFDHHAIQPGFGSVEWGEPRAVRLPEGCRSDGNLIDTRERPLERHTQLRLGERTDRCERHRRHLVLQALQLCCDLGRQHVEPGRHELPDLDHEPAQFDRQPVEALSEAPHPLRSRALGDSREPDARQQQFVPPRDRQIPAGESQDATVTRAGIAPARPIRSTRPYRRHPRQS